MLDTGPTGRDSVRRPRVARRGATVCLIPAAAAAFWLVAGCRSPVARPPVTVHRTAWSFGKTPGSQLTTPHYHIWTTCQSREFLEQIPRILEGAYEAYWNLLSTEAPPAGPMPVYLFGRRAEWERYTRARGGPNADTYLRIHTGAYEENGTTVAYYIRRRQTLAVLAHEGFHQFMTRSDRRGAPAWLNEGLACQFEAFTLDRDGWPLFRARDNIQRRKSLRAAIEEKRLIPISELLSMHAGHAIRAGSDRSGAYYGQVWALVLYLLESPDAPLEGDGFQRLLSDLGNPELLSMASRYRSAQSVTDNAQLTLDEAIFRMYITHDLPAFEARYHAFARELTGLAD